MKVRKGQKKVTLSDVYQLHYVYWRPAKYKGISYGLEIVSEEFMRHIKAQEWAPDSRPRWIVAESKSDDLIFHPPAPTAGNIIVRYTTLKEV